MVLWIPAGGGPCGTVCECNKGYGKRAERLKEDAGCYFQVNASSVVGEQGFAAKNVVKKLLKAGLVDFVGTDAHSDGEPGAETGSALGIWRRIWRNHGWEADAGRMREAILEDPGFVGVFIFLVNDIWN